MSNAKVNIRSWELLLWLRLKGELCNVHLFHNGRKLDAKKIVVPYVNRTLDTLQDEESPNYLTMMLGGIKVEGSPTMRIPFPDPSTELYWDQQPEAV